MRANTITVLRHARCANVHYYTAHMRPRKVLGYIKWGKGFSLLQFSKIMGVRLLLTSAALLLSFVSTNGQNVNVDECPDSVNCVTDPCALASCPNYPDAVCVANSCFGECRAEFLLGKKLRDVTDKCSVPCCEAQVCPEKRPVCVEERVPCPRNKTTCPPGKQVKISCERFVVALPSDCSMVLCANGQKCSVQETAVGPVAECIENVPESCDDLTCGAGIACVERLRADGVLQVRCIPERLEEDDCTNVVCSDNMICELTRAGRPRCVSKPPPSTCEQIECENGYECVLRNERRAVCIQTPNTEPTTSIIQDLIKDDIIGKKCSDIDCEPAYHCVMFGDTNLFGDFFIPRCIPNNCPRTRRPLSCQELECGRGEYCAVAVADGDTQPHPMCFTNGQFHRDLFVFDSPGERPDVGSGDFGSGSEFNCCCTTYGTKMCA